MGFALDRLYDLNQGLERLEKGYIPLSRVASRLEAWTPAPADAEARRVGEIRAGLVDREVERGRAIIGNLLTDLEDPQERAQLLTLDLQLQTIAEQADAAMVDPANATQLRTSVDQFSARVGRRVRALAQSSSDAVREGLVLTAALALVSIASGIALLGLAVISLRPIGRITREVQRIAGGDFGAPIEVDRRDELGILAEQVNLMARAIQQRDDDLRRSAEAELANRDRLARTERLALIGQMLAQITHEVRNPLNAMSLNCELLAEDLDSLPPERRGEARAMLGTVTAEIDRLEHLTEHYLSMARRPAPEPAPVDVRGMLEGVQRFLSEELRRSDVKLTLEIEEGPPVELDEAQVRQALLNVVRNAVEAGAHNVELRAERRDGLRIVISDDGPGIPEPDRAVEPFWSSKAKGTGLGLAITRQVVEDHGGSLAIEEGSPGARIVLHLPLPAWGAPRG